jgi:hypothetical protein
MQTGLKIKDDHFCIDSHRDSEDEFCEWFEDWFYGGIESASIITVPTLSDETDIPSSEYPDVISFESLVVGDKVYIVYVLYDEGDSFGWASSRGIDYVYATKHKHVADLIVKKISKQNVDGGECDYLSMDDLPECKDECLKLSLQWNGYFEKLSDVSYEEVTITK